MAKKIFCRFARINLGIFLFKWAFRS